LSSFFIQVADSIVEELNEAPADTFSRPIGTVARIYDPTRELPDLSKLRVDVVLGDRKSSAISRVMQKNLVRIDIAFRQKVDGEPDSDAETAELDGLVAFVEEVEGFFDGPPRRLKYADFAVWQQSDLVYPYLPSHLGGKRQFTSMLRLTYVVATK